MRSNNAWRVMMAVVVALVVWVAVPPSRLSAQDGSVPTINNPLVPTTVTPGGPGFTLTLNGAGFVQGSVVNWNGSPRTTTLGNQSQLTAAIQHRTSLRRAPRPSRSSNPGTTTISNVTFLSVASPLTSSSFVQSGSLSDGSQAQVMADFNGDGKLDVASVGDSSG